MKESIDQIQSESIQLLKQLIATPSFSREEDKTASIIQDFLQDHGVVSHRYRNNVWATNQFYDIAKPTILLNSHHDTVKPANTYTRDPFDPFESEGKLFGLGSNDAGASLVSLIAAFLYFNPQQHLKYNLVLAATAEEEISGTNGIELLIPHLPAIDFAIVGEPTQMNMAVAERGLLVMDCIAKGVAGHAARNEGDNALYKAINDIQTIQQLHFDKRSDLLGEVKLSITVIETNNKAHNVVPSECRFVIDARLNELYSLEDVFQQVRNSIKSEVIPRSMRLRSTIIPLDHPVVTAGKEIGKTYYGSPTTSDKSLMPFPALKIGPGNSARSHTADEYIYVHEIIDGINDYIQLLKKLLL